MDAVHPRRSPTGASALGVVLALAAALCTLVGVGGGAAALPGVAAQAARGDDPAPRATRRPRQLATPSGYLRLGARTVGADAPRAAPGRAIVQATAPLWSGETGHPPLAAVPPGALLLALAHRHRRRLRDHAAGAATVGRTARRPRAPPTGPLLLTAGPRTA